MGTFGPTRGIARIRRGASKCSYITRLLRVHQIKIDTHRHSMFHRAAASSLRSDICSAEHRTSMTASVGTDSPYERTIHADFELSAAFPPEALFFCGRACSWEGGDGDTLCGVTMGHHVCGSDIDGWAAKFGWVRPVCFQARTSSRPLVDADECPFTAGDIRKARRQNLCWRPLLPSPGNLQSFPLDLECLGHEQNL
jgi:hypothetical protein